MSVKGIAKELYIGKTKIDTINFIGIQVTVAYDNMKKIEYCFASKQKNGQIIFVKRTNEQVVFDFGYKSNDAALKAIDFIIKTCPELAINEKEKIAESITVQDTQTAQPSPRIRKKKRGEIRCPKCKSHNLQVITAEANTRGRTTLNLNLLKPFTIFDHEKIEKKRLSKPKLGAAIMTAGLSTVVTGGIKSKKGTLELLCCDCGHRWIQK